MAFWCHLKISAWGEKSLNHCSRNMNEDFFGRATFYLLVVFLERRPRQVMMQTCVRKVLPRLDDMSPKVMGSHPGAGKILYLPKYPSKRISTIILLWNLWIKKKWDFFNWLVGPYVWQMSCITNLNERFFLTSQESLCHTPKRQWRMIKWVLYSHLKGDGSKKAQHII